MVVLDPTFDCDGGYACSVDHGLFQHLGCSSDWQTLRQTNKTNVAAIKAADAATTSNKLMAQGQRPWLSIQNDRNAHFSKVVREDGSVYVRYLLRYKIKNHGNSPATAVNVSHKAVFGSILQANVEFDGWVDKLYNSSTHETYSVIFPSDPVVYKPIGNFERQNVSQDFEFLHVFLMVQYMGDHGSGVEAKMLTFHPPTETMNGPFGVELKVWPHARFIKQRDGNQ